jgi:hypothetical protein
MSIIPLTFAIQPIPGPFTAGLTGGTINLLVTNTTKQAIPVTGIGVDIPVGTSAADLTNFPKQITAGAPPGWTSLTPRQSVGHYRFLFTPSNPDSTVLVAAGDALVFSFGGIRTNSLPGTVSIVIMQGGLGSDGLTQPVDVSIFPPGWGSVSFQANPLLMASPGSVELSWAGPSGAAYEIEYQDPSTGENYVISRSNGQPLGHAGIYPAQGDPELKISATTTFSLTVTEVLNGVPLTSQQQRIVSVSPQAPVISSFNADIAWTPDGDLQVLLSWATDNATSVEGSWTSALLSANPETPAVISPPFNAGYSIKAIGEDGQSATATISSAWNEVRSYAAGTNAVVSAISPDGSVALILNSGENTLAIIHVRGGAKDVTICPLDPGATQVVLAARADGYYAVVTYINTNVWLISLADPELQPETDTLFIRSDSNVVSPDGMSLLAYSNEQKGVFLYRWGLENSRQFLTLAQQGIAAAFSPDNQTLLIQADTTLLKYSMSSHPLNWPQTLTTTVNPVNIAFLPDCEHAFMGDKSIFRIDTNPLSISEVATNLDSNPYIIVNPLDPTRIFIVCSETVYVQVTDLSNLKKASLPAQRDLNARISMTDGGRCIVIPLVPDPSTQNAVAVAFYPADMSLHLIYAKYAVRSFAALPSAIGYHYLITTNTNNTASAMMWGPYGSAAISQDF